MRAVIQRVSQASVAVDSDTTGIIGPGILLLLGVHQDDGKREVQWLAEKVCNLRIFEDKRGKMNLSLLDTGGAMLIVSQFTLYGNCRKGRRPGYSSAAPPDKAKKLYKDFISYVTAMGVETASGRFQAHMDVSLINDGPVTLLLDSSRNF